jgi:hypothetical protein
MRLSPAWQYTTSQRVIRKSKKKNCNLSKIVIAISHPDQWGFWEWLGQNTSVGVSPETFLLHPEVGGSIPAVAMVWRPTLAVWLDSTPCPDGCQRVIRKSKKKKCNLSKIVIAISHPDQWGFWEWLGQNTSVGVSPETFLLLLLQTRIDRFILYFGAMQLIFHVT